MLDELGRRVDTDRIYDHDLPTVIEAINRTVPMIKPGQLAQNRRDLIG